MSRWLPWLSELHAGAVHRDGARAGPGEGHSESRLGARSARRDSEIRAKALVTNRIGVMNIGGKRVHHVGMPWHWGWEGLARGDVVNDLTSLGR